MNDFSLIGDEPAHHLADTVAFFGATPICMDLKGGFAFRLSTFLSILSLLLLAMEDFLV